MPSTRDAAESAVDEDAPRLFGRFPRGPIIEPARYPFFDKLLFAFYVLLLPPLFASAPGLFGDGDVSWHVAAGQWILSNGQIPDADPFSFTMAGQPWVAHEWLAEIVLAAAFDFAGYAGLAAVATAAVMALHLVIFLHLRSRVGPLSTLVALVALDLILAKFLLARPHVLVWPLLALWTSVLLTCRDEGHAPPLPLALVMVIWTNLHGSFPLGLVIAAVIAFDAIAAAGWKRPALAGWVRFGLLAALASVLNLNGFEGLLHPFAIMGMDSLQLIQEWRPSSPSESPLFYVVLLATLALMSLKGAKLSLGETLLLLLLLALAFSQIRHQSWLVIVAAMMLTPRLAGRGREKAPPVFESGRDRRVWIGGSLGFAVAILIARLLIPLHPEESQGAPRALLAQIPEELRSQPVLNEYSFGGPLILVGIRPYIDGRADMYGDEFFRNYAQIVNGGDVRRFNRAVDRYRIRWTMLRHGSPLIETLDASPEWRRIYSDEQGVIHLRAS